MTYLTPEKHAKLREGIGEGRWLAAADLVALLDAADERDRLAAQIRGLAEWHETKAMKARRYRSGMNGQDVVMDKAAEVHDDAAWRLRRAFADE